MHEICQLGYSHSRYVSNRPTTIMWNLGEDYYYYYYYTRLLFSFFIIVFSKINMISRLRESCAIAH